MDVIARWTLYPVRSEQIKAAESDDHDHAEWVIRTDGPLPGSPVEVVPAEQLRGAVEALREYGRHKATCARLGASDTRPCDCGLADTLATLGVGRSHKREGETA